MTDNVRRRDVVVAVVYDPANESFLLWHNPKWREYAFPMKQIPDESTDQRTLAVQALQEAGYPIGENLVVEPVDRERMSLYSRSVQLATQYDYRVMQVKPQRLASPESLHPDLVYYPYDKLMDAVNVTKSTQKICRYLVMERHVALAVVCRRRQGELELLLVNKPDYGFFFPAKRIKSTLSATEVFPDLLLDDLGYDGPFELSPKDIVEHVQFSQRFGNRDVAFTFFPHRVMVEWDGQADEQEKWEALLESHVEAFVADDGWPADERYYRWITPDQLKADPQISKSVAPVLPAIMRMLQETT